VLTKRIIPCLDIKDGRTVKGINFINIRDAGDPVELGAAYAEQGADELVFLDISATNEKRKTLAHLVKEIAAHVNIPFTVGGGISSIADVEPLLEAGADKVSINSAAVKNPILIDQLAKAFGSQFVVLAIDARKMGNQWTVAAGGAGRKEDFLEAFVVGKADAALAATLFHFGEIKIPDLKNYLKNNGVPSRI